MERSKMKKKRIVTIVLVSVLLMACQRTDANKNISGAIEKTQQKSDAAEQEKGYDLPIAEDKRTDAIEECKTIMQSVQDIYEGFDKSSDTYNDDTKQMMDKMKSVIGQTGNPVIASNPYSVMENYTKLDTFLKEASSGIEGNVVLYEVDFDGGITSKAYTYDGTDMYVLETKMSWNEKENPVLTYITNTRMEQWTYTDRGNFCYKVCVPEPPEVTEIMDGSYIIRIQPLSEECRSYSEKYVAPLGYRGNNLLRSNWDSASMQDLDYNGVFEYFYQMKYGEPYSGQEESSKCPAEEFEEVIMTYLPVTAEQLRRWAVYDENDATYSWQRLGCVNYTPTHFDHSIPEVVAVTHNSDGTDTLTINAVCSSVICNDAVITHTLTIKLQENGAVQYLGNQMKQEEIDTLPQYQYRIRN